MNFIICVDEAEFDLIECRIYNQRKTEGHIGAGTTSCIQPRRHPTNSTVALKIGQYESYLTQDELDRIIELPADWFPKSEEP